MKAQIRSVQPPDTDALSVLAGESFLERIVVIGSSCAGKTTFARRLGGELGHPVSDLDELFWAPNWQAKPLEEFRRLAEQVALDDRWVVSGNYSDVRSILWPRATAVIWLNYGFAVILWRALSRTVRRVATREVLWQGNRESFRRSFLSRESILVWVTSTFHKRRRQFRALRESNAYPHLCWVEFNRPADAERFVCGLDETSKPSIHRAATAKSAAGPPRRSVDAMPDYDWCCLSCGEANGRANAKCAVCHCPAAATLAQLVDHRRRFVASSGGTLRAAATTLHEPAEVSAVEVATVAATILLGSLPLS